MNADDPLQQQFSRLQGMFLIVGLVGLGLCLLGAWFSPRQFYQSYLVAYLFWLGIALGCLGIVMLHHLVGGTWGFVIRRMLESGGMTLWLMLLLFAPILIGMREIYPWTKPGALAHAGRFKAEYLSPTFFLIRAAVYFAVWLVLAFFLNRWSLQEDEGPDPRLTSRLQAMSGPGLAFLFLTASFAMIDWVMSLESRWYSTIFGAMVVTGQALATLAFATLLASIFAPRSPLATLASPAQFNDLGNLLLAFVMLWTYMAFSQFLIIWCGNLVEEIPWYLQRTRGGWQWVALVLILFNFFLPFFALLFREVKRHTRKILTIASLILLMQLLYTFWIIAPAPVFAHPRLGLHWIDLTAVIGVGGLWLAFFFWQLRGKSLIPLHDPRLHEALAHASEA